MTALAEKMSERDVGELTDVALRLDHGAHELLVELMQHTGWDASELVGWALGAYWREMEGIVLPPPQPEQEIGRQPLGEDKTSTPAQGVREQPEPFQDEADSAFRRHFTPEQIADIEAGIEDVKLGRLTDHDEVFQRLEAKFGR